MCPILLRKPVGTCNREHLDIGNGASIWLPFLQWNTMSVKECCGGKYSHLNDRGKKRASTEKEVPEEFHNEIKG